MENHIDHPLTLTVEQAAKVLGIGRSTAYELVHSGDIPSLRLGRRIVVPAAEIARLIGLDPIDTDLLSASPDHRSFSTAMRSEGTTHHDAAVAIDELANRLF